MNLITFYETCKLLFGDLQAYGINETRYTHSNGLYNISCDRFYECSENPLTVINQFREKVVDFVGFVGIHTKYFVVIEQIGRVDIGWKPYFMFPATEQGVTNIRKSLSVDFILKDLQDHLDITLDYCNKPTHLIMQELYDFRESFFDTLAQVSDISLYISECSKPSMLRASEIAKKFGVGTKLIYVGTIHTFLETYLKALQKSLQKLPENVINSIDFGKLIFDQPLQDFFTHIQEVEIEGQNHIYYSTSFSQSYGIPRHTDIFGIVHIPVHTIIKSLQNKLEKIWKKDQ